MYTVPYKYSIFVDKLGDTKKLMKGVWIKKFLANSFPDREMDLSYGISRSGNEFMLCHFPNRKWIYVMPFPDR